MIKCWHVWRCVGCERGVSVVVSVRVMEEFLCCGEQKSCVFIINDCGTMMDTGHVMAWMMGVVWCVCV